MNEQANRALAEALRLAEHGYALTPVTLTRAATGKKAARFHKGWRHEAAWSSDPDMIKAWWFDHPDTSFAIGGGVNGIEGVDLDVKPELDVHAVADWSARGLPVSPFTQWTPSGGCHLIWRARPEGPTLPQEAGKTVGKGWDTRNRAGLFFASGAYVVGEEGHYETEGELPKLADLPYTPHDVLEVFAHVPDKAERPADGRIVTHDETWQRAQVHAALTAIAEHDRNEGGYRAKLQHAGLFLGRAVDQGFLTVEAAEARILDAHRSVWGPTVFAENLKDVRDALKDGPRLERWRVPPTLPTVERPSALAGPATVTARVDELPTDADLQADAWLARPPAEDVDPAVEMAELADAVELRDLAGQLGSVRMAKAVLSERARRAARRAEDEAERPPRPDIESLVVWDDELESVTLPTMALEELIPERGVGWLGGPSGTYKSFVAIQIARALAHGVPALGHREFTVDRARRVLYVAGEDSDGVAMRSRAARHRLGVVAGRQLVQYPRPIDLTSEREVEDLVAFVVRHEIGFVIVDTFRQSTLGVNENDNSEVGVILGRLIGLRDRHDVGSMLIDHTNKSAQGLADLGGAGAKRANADYVLMIDLPNGSRDADQQRTLRVAKLKNLPDGRTWPIRLDTVPAVTDAKGRPSAVAVVGEVLPDVEAWQMAGLTWTDGRWNLPADVTALQGRGANAARDLARYMRVQAADPQGTGESRLEAIKVLRATNGRGGVGVYTDDTILRHGWSRLVELGRLVPKAADATGKSTWVSQVSDPKPPGPDDPM